MKFFKKKKMTVGLIFGGRGAENFSNLRTVKDIESVLNKFQIRTRRFNLNTFIDVKLLKQIDIALVVDSFCKNQKYKIKIWKFLKMNGIPSIRQGDTPFLIARDKHQTNTLAKKVDIRVPTSIIIDQDKKYWVNKISSFAKAVGFPIIAKDNFGSSSENLFVCLSYNELISNTKLLLEKCQKVLVEEYVSGKEITVPAVKIFKQFTILNPIEIKYKGLIYDFKVKNITFRNKILIPPKLAPQILTEVKKVALKINKKIGTDYYSRTDFKIQNGKVIMLEINGEPVLSKNDFVSRSARTLGINYKKLVIGLLSNSDKFLRDAKRNNMKLYKYITQSMP